NAIAGVSPVVTAWVMYVFQSVFNFFVVSGSGQAALTMPLMAPLADIAGVSRQVAVVAFQLGDGFTNLIVPTSACLMACIGAARIDWATWAKWQIKFQGVLFLFGSLFVMGGVLIGLK
ncbi:MAG: AbgT family transporter, partial [Cloacibacillus sp.]